MSGKALVLDANILIRGVSGKRVRAYGFGHNTPLTTASISCISGYVRVRSATTFRKRSTSSLVSVWPLRSFSHFS